jgi:transposase InsO family protein
MIDRSHDLPLARQAELLRLSRRGLYYEAQPVPEAELAIMRRIDALHLDYPFAGSRMLRDRRMCIEALYCRPNTSKPAPGHKIYPYLHGKPAIFNTDQGSQFTSAAFTSLLLEHGNAISMDGRGSWRDNVFVEQHPDVAVRRQHHAAPPRRGRASSGIHGGWTTPSDRRTEGRVRSSG